MPYTEEQLDEMDRNARAYGYEIGRQNLPLLKVIEIGSPDNPFLNKNWRDNIVDNEEKDPS